MKTTVMRCFVLMMAGMLGSALGAQTQIVDQGAYRWTISYETNQLARIEGCVERATGSTSITGEVLIPSMIGGHLVTALGDNLFAGCAGLESVKIPSSVSSFGESVFSGCISLESIKIPAGVTLLSSNLFKNCWALKSVTIPDTVTNLEAGVFSGCSGLKSVSLSSNLKSLAPSAFSGCTSLASIRIPWGVATIGESAFSGCWALSSITLPSSVRKVGMRAFSGCLSASTLSLPEGLVTISSNAFTACTSLQTVRIPSTVQYVEASAFSGCWELTSVTFLSDTTVYEENAFSGCPKLTAITLPANGHAIAANAYYGNTTLKTFSVSAGITSIGADAFHFCSAMTSVTLPEGLQQIGANAFAGCSALKAVTIPGGVTNIEAGTFSYCTRLSNVVLKYGIKEIGANAFLNCSSLQSITIPSSVTSIVSTAFAGTNLRTIYFSGKPPLIAGDSMVRETVITTNDMTGVVTTNVVITTTGDISATPFGTLAIGYYSAGAYEAWQKELGGESVGAWYGVPMQPYAGAEVIEIDSPDWEAGTNTTVNTNAAKNVAALLSRAAQVYYAVVSDAASGAPMASLQIKASKANKKTGESKLTIAIQFASGGKKTLRGSFAADGTISIPTLEAKGDEIAWAVNVETDSISGMYSDETGTYLIEGARDLFSSKDKTDKAAASAALSEVTKAGAHSLAWAEGDGSGWSYLSFVIGSRGKVKVAGVLAGGTKVSTSAQLVMGASAYVLPITYSKKKAEIACLVTILPNGQIQSVVGLGSDTVSGPVSNLETAGRIVIDPQLVSVRAMDEGVEVYLDMLPNGLEVTRRGTKWTLGEENLAQAKLAYRAKDGTFTGSFKVYYEVNGRERAASASVAGVVIEGVGYGSASVKKVGAVPLTIE